MLRHAVLALLVFVTLIRTVNYNKGQISAGPLFLPVVADELYPALRKKTVICARKPHIVWYLNSHFKEYPTFTFLPVPGKNVVAELRKAGVDYLFISDIEAGLRPEIQPLLYPQNAPPDFTLIYYRPTVPVAVYEITRAKPEEAATDTTDPSGTR